MRAATNWHDYELIDTTSGEKLERWKNITLIRPDPQIIWKTGKNSPGWNRADAHYHRSKTGGGHWEYVHKLPESWKISYGDLTFKISPTGFKHTGLFPEQAVNWDLFMKLIREARRPISVLNLFAYTGGEAWKLAASISDLVQTCAGALSDKPLFFLPDSSTTDRRRVG